MRLIVAIFLLSALPMSWAQSAYPRPAGWEWFGTSIPNGTVGVEYTTGGAKLVGGSGGGAFIGRNFGQPSSSGVAMAESVGVKIGGAEVAVVGARFVTAAEIANGAALLYGAWSAGTYVGSKIADYLDLGTRLAPDDHGWQLDAGQASQSLSGWDCSIGEGYGVSGSLSGACSIAAGKAQAIYSHDLFTVAIALGACSGNHCDYMETDTDLRYGTNVTSVPGVATGHVTTTQACPASVDALNPGRSRQAGSQPDPDGKCPTGRYNHIPFDAAVKRMVDSGNPDAFPGLVPDIIAHGVPLSGIPMPAPTVGFPGSLTGPGSVAGPSGVTTTTPPGGAPSTTVNNTTVNLTYTGGNTISYVTTNTTTGPGGTTTTTQQPDVKTCGVPGQAPCKIDETGTPSSVVDPSLKITDALKDPAKVAADPSGFFPKLPALNWSFQLPTACGVIQIPAFAEFLPSIDVCQFAPMFQDLMSVVWLMGGLFGAIRLFMLDALAS